MKPTKTNKEKAVKFYNEGFAYLKAGYIPRAIRHFTKAIVEDPEHAASYNCRALCNGYLQNDLQAAICDYDKAIELDPGVAQYYRNRAAAQTALTYSFSAEAAIADLTKAVELQSSFTQAWLERGIAFYRARNFTQAIEDFTNTIKLDKEDGGVFLRRGRAYESIDDYKKAIADYKMAVKLDIKFSHIMDDVRRCQAHMRAA